MSASKILITGITGQDGIFLSSYLLNNIGNIEIFGTTTSKENSNFYKKLTKIIKDEDLNKINLINIDLTKSKDVESLIKTSKIDKIAHLSGPSSVYNSYLYPEESKNTILTQFENLVQGCTENNHYPDFFQASSSEMFDSAAKLPLSETSKMKPRSPYAEAKYTLHKRVSELREKKNWNIKSGIMFNHESEFRQNEFLIMKVITGLIEIKESRSTELVVGSLNYSRDWTYAPEIVRAISDVLFEESPTDYVIGCGKGHTILNMIEIVSSYFDLNYKDFIRTDESLLRKGDPTDIVSDPSLIYKNLGWKAQTTFQEMIEKIIEFKLSNL